MGYCIKCGTKLLDEAEFCTKCGTPIKSMGGSQEECKDKKSILEQIEKSAEDFGKKAEYIGKRIEKKADDVGYYVNQWYDRTFKITGPLIGAFIILILLRVIIYGIQVSGKDIFIVTALGEGLYEFLLFIFLVTLILGYNTYFNRKYKRHYQWVYPLISAFGFIIGLWIVAQIMLIISQSNATPIIEAIGFFINSYILVIFIFALIIGYTVQFFYHTNNSSVK